MCQQLLFTGVRLVKISVASCWPQTSSEIRSFMSVTWKYEGSYIQTRMRTTAQQQWCTRHCCYLQKVFRQYLTIRMYVTTDINASEERQSIFYSLIGQNVCEVNTWWPVRRLQQRSYFICRFRWPRGLSRKSAAAGLLGLRARIPPGHRCLC